MPGKADEARGRISALEKNQLHTHTSASAREQTKTDKLDDPAKNDPNAVNGPSWKKVGSDWVDTEET